MAEDMVQWRPLVNTCGVQKRRNEVVRKELRVVAVIRTTLRNKMVGTYTQDEIIKILPKNNNSESKMDPARPQKR
jgi:hypothetical protein